MVYRTNCYKTTWRFRILALALLLSIPIATLEWWLPALGRSLVCDSEFEKPDLIVIDNLDTNFLLFEKASELQGRNTGIPVLVPVHASWQNCEEIASVERGIAELMIRAAHVESVEFLKIRSTEPITLNTARQICEFLQGKNVRTVLVLTSGFKSKRIHLIFTKALSEVGLETYCLPVWGSLRPENWTKTWHGIQEVLLQHAKLAYYRLWVLW